MCINYFYVTQEDEPTPEVSCTNAANPLFGSCLEDLLLGCYEPDLSGECTVDAEMTLHWEDGSKLVQGGQSPGLYAPGEDEPCIGLEVDGNVVTLAKGDEEISYLGNEQGLALRCDDGTTFGASQFELFEFAVCRGLACRRE